MASNFLESFTSQLDIILVCLPAFFLKGMEYVYGVGQMYHIDDSPLTQYMNSYLLDTGTYLIRHILYVPSTGPL